MSILPEVTAPERKVRLAWRSPPAPTCTDIIEGHLQPQDPLDRHHPPHLPRLLASPTLRYHVVRLV